MQTQSQDATERQQHPTYLSTEQLYRAHRPFVARFLTRLGVRPEALDDAVQEVFVTVHRRGGYVLGPAKPTSYLATIAINTAAAQRRSSRKSAARRCDQEPEDLAACGGDPGQVLETQQELSRLDRALSKLDPTLRATLLAADGEGETCVAIADATSVPLGTVYWRLDRARKKFREALRVVDGPQRRRAGMFLAFFSVEDLRSFARKLTSAKFTIGASALLGLAIFALHDRKVAPQREQPSPVVVAQPALRVPARTLPEVTAFPEKVAPPIQIEERAHVRRRSSRRRAVSDEVTLSASAAITTTAPVSVTAPVERPEERREPARELSETAQLARAEALLVDHPRDALTLVRSLDKRENANYLREERDYIESMALLSIDPELGRKRAASFLRAYPSSAFARIVQVRSGAR